MAISVLLGAFEYIVVLETPLLFYGNFQWRNGTNYQRVVVSLFETILMIFLDYTSVAVGSKQTDSWVTWGNSAAF